MPFFRTAGKLVYYAHVPKCGGSAIATYITTRFGALAFHDNGYLRQPPAARWTRSSPQHVDAASLARLIPPAMFDAVFTVVRHPVARCVSTYHFQREVEGTVPPNLPFSDWLAQLAPNGPDEPFAYDNHIRPMTDIVPAEATVFHLEHGLDALVPWFDAVAGDAAGGRAILPENERGAHGGAKDARARPTAADIARIAALYAADFARFGYVPDEKLPKTPAPVLPPEMIAARDRELAAARRPLARAMRSLGRRLRQGP
jgi:hypothetical protein